MATESPNQLKWKNLDGEQKYEVVELARRQGMPIQELCATFGVSRQTLYRAMEAADRAAIDALSPKPRGRPPVPVTQKEILDLRTRNKELEQDLKQQKLKNEVAQALLDLQRKAERGQRLPGGKKRGPRDGPRNPTGLGPAGTRGGMATKDDG